MNGDKRVKPEDRRLLGALEDAIVENTREQQALRQELGAHSQPSSGGTSGNGIMLKWALGLLASFIVAAVIGLFTAVQSHQDRLVALEAWRQQTDRDRFRPVDALQLERRVEEYMRDLINERHSP